MSLIAKLLGQVLTGGRRDLKRELTLRALGIDPRGPRKPRRPGSAPALVEPPRGPLPLQGGAQAPLEFDA